MTVKAGLRDDRLHRRTWLISDATIWFAAICVAAWLPFDPRNSSGLVATILAFAAAASVAYLIIGSVIGPYGIGPGRTSFKEGAGLGGTVLVSTGALLILAFFASPLAIPYSIPIVAGFLALAGMSTARFLIHSWRNHRLPIDGAGVCVSREVTGKVAQRLNDTTVIVAPAPDSFRVPSAGSGDVVEVQPLLGRKSMLMGMAVSGFAVANATQPSASAATPVYVPKWAPSTTYPLGQQVISPNNDVVSAIVAHRSSAAYATDTAKWTISATFASKATETTVTSGRLSNASLTAAFAKSSDVRALNVPKAGVRIDVTKMHADNAPAALVLPTPDGTGQLTHSAIVYAPGGWNGFKYWMAATPYFASNSQVENPCIYAANDPSTVGGANGWRVPTGLTNPIEPTPPSTGLNSDPDLEFGPDGLLYCFWRQYREGDPVGTKETICVKSSATGAVWSAKTALIVSNERVISPCAPSIVYNGEGWEMWAVDIVPSPNQAIKYTAPAPLGPWSGPTKVALTTANIAVDEIWHIDVNKFGDQYHILVNATDRDVPGAGGSLYLGSSDDAGLTWAISTTPFLTSRPWAFDSSFYRSSMVPVQRGDEWGYEVIYAGISRTGGRNYSLGYTIAGFDQHRHLTAGKTVGPVHFIAEPNHVNLLASRIPLPPFIFGDLWQRADAATLGNAESGQAWTTWSGAPGIISHQACATTAANTKVVIAGSADGYCEVDLKVFGAGEMWLVFRGSSTNNYWRVGCQGGAVLAFQKVVAGSARDMVSADLGILTPNDRVGVLCVGAQITVLLNGTALGTWTDNFNQTAEMTGWQADNVSSRFGPIYARGLIGGA